MRIQSKPTFVYYLYALTGAENLTTQSNQALKGLEDTNTEFIKVKNIVAVFGKVSGQDYSKENIEVKVQDLSWLEQRVYEHYHVQQALTTGQCAIVPLKFCTLFKTKRKIQEFIIEQHALIENLLERLQGNQEWCVKVFRNKLLFKKNLARFDPDIGSRIQLLTSESNGRAFMLKKKLLQDIEAASAKLTKACVVKLVEDLKKVSLEWQQNETFAVPEEKDEEMILNFAFLLPQNNTGKLKRRVNKFNDKYSEAGLALRCSGPWLPYNFVALSGVESFGQ